MIFSFNKKKEEVKNSLRTRADAGDMYVAEKGDRVTVKLLKGAWENGEDAFRFAFTGKVKDTENGSEFKGRFWFGWFYTLAAIAIVGLVILRIILSIKNNEMTDLWIAVACFVALVIVIIVVFRSSRKAKEIISNYIENVDK
ncbi:MAG: hypothetical protein IJF94_00895 [Eubacterium sp.]|nr:hypothetical protein [Eubacterium sp.]